MEAGDRVARGPWSHILSGDPLDSGARAKALKGHADATSSMDDSANETPVRTPSRSLGSQVTGKSQREAGAKSNAAEKLGYTGRRYSSVPSVLSVNDELVREVRSLRRQLKLEKLKNQVEPIENVASRALERASEELRLLDLRSGGSGTGSRVKDSLAALNERLVEQREEHKAARQRRDEAWKELKNSLHDMRDRCDRGLQPQSRPIGVPSTIDEELGEDIDG